MWSPGKSRFFINSASIFGGEAVARLATALMALLIARLFGPEELGNYGYALAMASILLIVPDFGLHLFTVRELSASPHQIAEIFWGVHWLKAGLAGFVALFAFCFGEWGIADRGRRLVFYILVARVVLQSFSQATMAVFKAFERMHLIAMQQFVNTIVVVAWAVASVVLATPPSLLIAGLVVGQLAETYMGWHFLRTLSSDLHFKKWNGKRLALIAAGCFPIGLTSILLALNLRIDILVLGRYAGSETLGQFNAAAWFIIAAFLVASLFMSILFPKLSRLLIEHSAQGSDYVLGLLKNALLVTALGSLLVWISAHRVLPLFFSSDFAPAAHILRILTPAVPLVVLNTIFFYVFSAARKRFVCLIALGLGVALGTVLSISLTARYGPAGTATADVAREFAVSTIYLFFLVQGNQARVAGVALLKVFLGATALMFVTMMLATPLHLQVMWLAAWMLFVFVGTLIVFGLPTQGEWRLLTDDRL